MAIKFISERYKKKGVTKFYLFPDPPAEDFYLKCGAKHTGEKSPSRVTSGPTFSKIF